MKNLKWLFETLFSRWRMSGNLKYLEILERRNLEDLREGRKRKASHENIRDIRSKYQYDLLHGDETSNNMMLQ